MERAGRRGGKEMEDELRCVIYIYQLNTRNVNIMYSTHILIKNLKNTILNKIHVI